MSLLILGIGNILLTDEGVGVYAVQRLEQEYCFPEEVEVLDGGTSGIELLGYIRGRDQLIIIDAVASGQEPGTVIMVEDEDVPAFFSQRISPHQLGLSDLLAVAGLAGDLPPALVLFGVEPFELATGLGLSKDVAASMEKLLVNVVAAVRGFGYQVTAVPDVEHRTDTKEYGAMFWQGNCEQKEVS